MTVENAQQSGPSTQILIEERWGNRIARGQLEVLQAQVEEIQRTIRMLKGESRSRSSTESRVSNASL